MESEGSLPCSQEPATCPYRQLGQQSTVSHRVSLKHV
jgi:hypothetical protein